MGRLLCSMLVAVTAFSIAATGALAGDDDIDEVISGTVNCNSSNGRWLPSRVLNLATGSITSSDPDELSCPRATLAVPGDCAARVADIAEFLADEDCDTRQTNSLGTFFVSYVCLDGRSELIDIMSEVCVKQLAP